MKRLAITLLTACIGLAGGLLTHAQATTVEGFELNDATRKVHREYGPLPPGPTDQVLVPTLGQCNANAGAALIPVETNFKRIAGSLFKFVVNWAEADTFINAYFFDEDGNVIAQHQDGPPSRPKRPKEMNLGNLENGNYFVCVINSGGANAGFTLDATVSFAGRYTPPPDGGPVTRPTEPPTPPPAEEPAATPAVRAPSTPAPVGEPVATPGPDGPDRRQGLLAVSGNRQAAARNTRSIAQLVFLGLTIAVGVVGIVLVALRIRRDTA